MAVDYIAGKKNSLKAKKEKASWYESQIRLYTEKAAAMREEAKADETVLLNIETLQDEKKALETEIAQLKTRITQPIRSELTVEDMFERIKTRETQIDEIDSKIRILYYGK